MTKTSLKKLFSDKGLTLKFGKDTCSLEHQSTGSKSYAMTHSLNAHSTVRTGKQMADHLLFKLLVNNPSLQEDEDIKNPKENLNQLV